MSKYDDLLKWKPDWRLGSDMPDDEDSQCLLVTTESRMLAYLRRDGKWYEQDGKSVDKGYEKILYWCSLDGLP